MMEQAHLVHFVENDSVLCRYKFNYSDYYPRKYERLRDYAPNNAKAKAKKLLIFLLESDMSTNVTIPKGFFAPNTHIFTEPRAYDELKYCFHNMELRMEF